MYIRIKKIKGINYAYLVKSYWSKRRKTPKQKTLCYLGRVYKFQKIENKNLIEHFGTQDIEKYFKKEPIKKIIKELIKLELSNYNFKETKPNIWTQDKIIVNLVTKKVYASFEKPACIEINNNFLSTKTLRNILNLRFPPNLNNTQIYKYLASSFLSVGIALPEDKFILLSQRILKSL